MAGRQTRRQSTEDQRYRGNIGRFYCFMALIGFQFFLPIWVIFLREERGLRLEQITALEAPLWLTAVLLEAPTGAVADRWGRKFSLCCGAALLALGLFVFGVATAYPLLFASYLIFGAAITLFSGADAAFFYDTLKALGRADEYQRLYGRAWAIQSGAMSCGLLLGAPLARLTTLQTPVLCSTVVAALAFGVALTLREPPRFDDGAERPGLVRGMRLAAGLVWRTPGIRFMVPLASAVVAGAGVLQLLIQPFLRRHEVDIAFFGVLLLPSDVGGLATALLAHRVVAVVGLRTVMIGLPALILGALLVFAVWDAVWALVWYPAAGVAVATVRTLVSDYHNQRVPSAQRATVLSFQQLVSSLLFVPVAPLAGLVGDRLGLPAGYLAVAGVVALVAAPALALWLRATGPPGAADDRDKGKQSVAEPRTAVDRTVS
ncbi:MAG: MFS transporter [Dehalococcoidia bacterium]